MSDGRGVRRPPGQGWVITAEAAKCLGVSRATVDRLRRSGRLEARLHDRAWWIRDQSLVAITQERSRWISHATAAEEYGIPTSTITAAVVRGELRPRDVNHSLPSLDRGEVAAWLAARGQRRAEREKRRREREERRTTPPEDGRVWLDAETVAIMLGRSARRIRMLAQEDRLPHLRRGRRVWFLREHIEEISAARAFEQQQRLGPG